MDVEEKENDGENDEEKALKVEEEEFRQPRGDELLQIGESEKERKNYENGKIEEEIHKEYNQSDESVIESEDDDFSSSNQDETLTANSSNEQTTQNGEQLHTNQPTAFKEIVSKMEEGGEGRKRRKGR